MSKSALALWLAYGLVLGFFAGRVYEKMSFDMERLAVIERINNAVIELNKERIEAGKDALRRKE